MLTTKLRPADDTRIRLGNLFALIARELAEAERIYATALASNYAFVQGVVDHAAGLRGKRLRPALLLLAAKASGELRPDHCVLAAVVEMIHTATLIHDDILDESVLRRHEETVNARWGNETAVLLGDYLFTHAFHLAASLESTLACRWIGRATNGVCEGEMVQVHNRGNLDLDEDQYIDIIRGKTAELTAVACRLGAHYAGAPASVVDGLELYGREVGVAFQIADDVLDLLAEENQSGKTMGTDVQKQKLTLPLIYLLRTAEPKTRARVRGLLSLHDEAARADLRGLVEQSDALEYCWERAGQSVATAIEALECLADSEARRALEQAASLVVRRTY
jgi:octaprenyl-diphosphate synthase